MERIQQYKYEKPILLGLRNNYVEIIDYNKCIKHFGIK